MARKAKPYEWILEIEAGGVSFPKTVVARSFRETTKTVCFFDNIDGRSRTVCIVMQKNLVFMERKR